MRTPTIIILLILLSVPGISTGAVKEENDTVTALSDVDSHLLDEVVVTAKEGDGLSSSSKIGRDAMEHLQPTSFSDLLELLPGNISQNPEMGKANTITLRETGNLGATGVKTDNDDYSISSLGTLFMVDGAPINGDANLQGTGIGTSDSPTSVRNITNKGVDMRSISTDNIESVEIVRGIPSAEYGNLTSGLVKIKRISRRTPFTARFKADEYSKLFAASKGIGFREGDAVLNIDVSFLDSKTDPRNNLENYRRLTGSARFNSSWQKNVTSLRWNIGADYTGSFDNTKSDPDLNYMKIDEYKSLYNRFSLTSDLQIDLWGSYFFNSLNVNTSLSYQNDELTRRKQVAPQRASVAPTTMLPGESKGEYLLGEYIADFHSQNRPVNYFLKGRAEGEKTTGSASHNYKAGLEWTISKNLGHGQTYDLRRPLSASWTTRPRDFSDIPALQVLNFFLEERITLPVGKNTLIAQAGLRGMMLPGLSSKYYLHNRPYLDPRLNMSWEFPTIGSGRNALRISLNGGFGLTTKMPTIDYLYPQVHYTDIIQLNYYDAANPVDNSAISLMTYIDETVNYNLRAARNRKWEVSINAGWRGNSLNVTYFRENLTSGFRYSAVYAPYSYKDYDASAIDPSTLTGPPSISSLPYKETQVLRGYRTPTNGTAINKQGIEFTLTTARFKPLRTRLTINGAWFHSKYSNSECQYATVNDVVDGTPVSDLYVGIYNYRDGRVNDQFNTNFMFDTQIPKWGLVFTTSFQCLWWVKTTRMAIDGTPDAYLSATDGLIHDYPAGDIDDKFLPFLVKHYNDESFRTVKIPFAGYFNLKATKSIGRHFKIALFVNRILDWLPDYRANGLLVRRSSDAYFGMELNISI
ncbi:MAG: TonB-dependent receptor plug domain-containing protein [Bacteroidales bacterium]|nr:TonB-dependent receptor plug domain-containing protein [Bacteroidales bacterium]